MRLGSAVSAVNEQAGILTRLMGANGPHYCEDPLLDRQNEAFRMARALISRLAMLTCLPRIHLCQRDPALLLSLAHHLGRARGLGSEIRLLEAARRAAGHAHGTAWRHAGGASDAF